MIVMKVVPWKGYNKWKKSCYQITCSEQTKLSSFCDAVSSTCEYSNTADRVNIKCVGGSYLFCANIFYIDGKHPETIDQIQDKLHLLNKYSLCNDCICHRPCKQNCGSINLHDQENVDDSNYRELNNYCDNQQPVNQTSVNNSITYEPSNINKISSRSAKNNGSNNDYSSQNGNTIIEPIGNTPVCNQSISQTPNSETDCTNNNASILTDGENQNKNECTLFNNSSEVNNVSFQYSQDNNNQPKLMDMQNIKMCDLIVQIGSVGSMVYCHRGVCEHSLEVLDVRLIDKKDDRRLSVYPIVWSELGGARKHCDICGRINAEYVSYMDADAPREPCNWCTCCFISWYGCRPENSDAQVLPIVYS
eukprot:TRINITY_DN33284_c0_g1_i1.p1 TRINITY_DN33284_c0_g1~~TRINITY_DN33284_c0_g1_i1.p1  ORF type:complete len:362 (+),score=17.95 TRINITY_DN33284_c0_g1_i1:797-1882(+)